MRRTSSALSASLATALVLTMASPVAAVPTACDDASAVSFTDVPGAGIFADAISCVAGFSLVGGFGNGTFGPDDDVNRGQAAAFVTALIETADGGTSLTPESPNPFTDVAAGGVFSAAILKLVNIEVVAGITATTYEPSRLLTRGEMARIVANALEHLGVTLDTSSAGFTDVTGPFAGSINALANLGVVQGLTTTTFGPGANVTRGELASFTAEAIGPLDTASLWNPPVSTPTPGTDSGSGTIISVGANTYTFVDSSGNTTAVTYDATNDTFTSDGVTASEPFFEASANPGDTVVFTEDASDDDEDVHALTNRTVLSGIVGAIDINANTFQIIEPLTGTPIGDGTPDTPNDNGVFTYADDGSDTFTGAAVLVAAFENEIQIGDTIVVSDDDGDNTYDDFALTNRSLSGRVADLDASTNVDGDGGATTSDDVEFTIGGLGDFFDHSAGLTLSDADGVLAIAPTNVTQTYTLNGSSGAAVAAVVAAISNGDTITYSRTGGTENFVLTDSAPADLSSVTVTDGTNTGANTVGYIVNGARLTFDYSVVAGGQQALYFVDGGQVIETEFEAAITSGDTINIQDDDAATNTNQVLRLTNGNLTGIATTFDTIDDGSDQNEVFDVDTSGGVAIDEDVTTAGVDLFFVNGGAVPYGTFEEYLQEVDADASPDDTLVYVLDNGDGVSEMRLTTDETL